MKNKIKRFLFAWFIKISLQILYLRNSIINFSSPIQSHNNYNPVFIVGSGRSGNTLLRRILNKNDSIFIPPETYVLGKSIINWAFLPFIGLRRLKIKMIENFINHKEFHTFGLSDQKLMYQSILENSDTTSLADTLNAFYQHYADVHKIKSGRWGDKTPLNTFYVYHIRVVFPDAKFVHIKRNPFDTISSYLNSGIYTQLDEAISRWFDSITFLNSFAKSYPNSIIEVTYEDLVNSPDETTRRICNFLDIRFDNSMLSVGDDVNLLGDVSTLQHHENVKKPINNKNIGKGKSSLTKEQVSRIERFLKKHSVEIKH